MNGVNCSVVEQLLGLTLICGKGWIGLRIWSVDWWTSLMVEDASVASLPMYVLAGVAVCPRRIGYPHSHNAS